MMCTAISYQANSHYFGRTLDLEYTYHESVTVTPRRFPFPYADHPTDGTHYAIIGIATVMDGYPLYYDAVNEHGLGIAGLNFVGNAVYHPKRTGMLNLAQFELIPRLLGRCKNLSEARSELERINLLEHPFRPDLPLARLHWMLSDRSGSVTAEPMADGLHIYENPLGVLTNNPPFPYQMENLCHYRNLSPREEASRFSETLPLPVSSRGMGAMGLPGDLSSPSRFVRAAFVKLNSVMPTTESASVSQFFHILGSVEQVEGCVRLDRENERTQYTSCCNTDQGTYYYTTYSNRQITAVSLFGEDLNGCELRVYPLVTEEQILFQNKK